VARDGGCPLLRDGYLGSKSSWSAQPLCALCLQGLLRVSDALTGQSLVTSSINGHRECCHHCQSRVLTGGCGCRGPSSTPIHMPHFGVCHPEGNDTSCTLSSQGYICLACPWPLQRRPLHAGQSCTGQRNGLLLSQAFLFLHGFLLPRCPSPQDSPTPPPKLGLLRRMGLQQVPWLRPPGSMGECRPPILMSRTLVTRTARASRGTNCAVDFMWNYICTSLMH
jgi:hypothetical protein